MLRRVAVSLALSAVTAFGQVPDTIAVTPRLATTAVLTDADDPAIWIHPTRPERSLILGTDKGAAPNGGLYAWNLDGSLQQRLVLPRPNNVDVRRGVPLGGQLVDLAVVTMRADHELRVFAISPETRTLTEITTAGGIEVFKSPYGLTLYQRWQDRALFAIVSSKHDSTRSQLWQLRLHDDGSGRVQGTLVRQWGNHAGIIEGMVADDQLGYLYASEQGAGIHKYYADPEQGDEPLALFATEDGIAGNHKGLALYACPDGTGYLLLATPRDQALRLYPRAGEPGQPHRHRLLTTVRRTQGETGVSVEVTNFRTSNDFANGLLVWHDELGRRFHLIGWEEIARDFLHVCVAAVTSSAVADENAGAGIAGFALHQNHPNPFNPQTRIPFDLPAAGWVQVAVFDVLGRRLKTLQEGWLPAGAHAAWWDATDERGQTAPSGVYYLRLHTAGFIATRKMTLLR